MKNTGKIIGLIVAFLLIAMPVFAMMETTEIAPAKTLADFQRQYSDTKPMIGWHKYQEYLQLQRAPRPTLAPSRMREEWTMISGFSGSKPIATFTGRHESRETGLFWTTEASGTKPSIAFLRRA